MAGIGQVLMFPFWVCFGWGNKNMVGGAHKRLDPDEEAAPEESPVPQRIAAAESIAFLDQQLESAREVTAHEEQRAAELHEKAKRLYAAGRHTESRQAMSSCLIAQEAARKMGARVVTFERTVNTLKLNAVDAQFTSMLRAAADAARAQATGTEAEEISKLQQELAESMKSTERSKGILDAGLSRDDVYIDENGAAVSMQEKLEAEMRALASASSHQPAPPLEKARPASAYTQGIAPNAASPAPVAAKPQKKIAVV